MKKNNVYIYIYYTFELRVCVCVFSSHSFWTSSSLYVPAGVTQEEGHTGFLIHLLSREKCKIDFQIGNQYVECEKIHYQQDY